MKFYQVRKKLSRDNGETLDTLIRCYSCETYANNKAAILEKVYGYANLNYYVKEVDRDQIRGT